MVMLFLSCLWPDLHEIWHEDGPWDQDDWKISEFWLLSTGVSQDIPALWQCCQPIDKTIGEDQAPSNDIVLEIKTSWSLRRFAGNCFLFDLLINHRIHSYKCTVRLYNCIEW